MDDRDEANLESDPRFFSGEWTGFFLQYWLPGRHTTNMSLTWRDGQVEGTGRDKVGSYTIQGTYDVATGRCEWTKRYQGRHTVAYRGVSERSGVWGVWELPQLGGLFKDRGGFHIWPQDAEVSEDSENTEQAVLAAMRKEFGARYAVAAGLLGLLLLAAGVTLAFLRHWVLDF